MISLGHLQSESLGSVQDGDHSGFAVTTTATPRSVSIPAMDPIIVSRSGTCSATSAATA